MSSFNNEHIDLPISKKDKDLIKHAAEISGYTSISEFIVTIAKNEAIRILKEEASPIKSKNDKVFFVETLLNPPSPNKALKAAAKFYDDLLKSNANGFSV